MADLTGTPCPECGEEEGGTLLRTDTGYDCDNCSYHEEDAPKKSIVIESWEDLQRVMADFDVTFEDLIGAALNHKEKSNG